MFSDALSGLVALEICSAFEAPAAAPVVISAFHELVSEVAAIREQTITDEDISADTLQRCAHLLEMSQVITAELTVCAPAVQGLIRAQLSVTTAWLDETRPG